MVSMIILSVVDHGLRLRWSNGQHDHLECGRSWVQTRSSQTSKHDHLECGRSWVQTRGVKPVSMIHLECGRSWVQTTWSQTSKHDHLECGRSWVQTLESNQSA